MKFEPKTEKQIQEMACLPKGDYKFEVISAVDGVSKKGNDMIAIKILVYRPFSTEGKIVLDWIMEAMAFKLRHFCESIGLLKEYETGILDAHMIEGKTGIVSIIVKDDEKYGKKNEVKDYVVGELKSLEQDFEVKVHDDMEDSIPF